MLKFLQTPVKTVKYYCMPVDIGKKISRTADRPLSKIIKQTRCITMVSFFLFIFLHSSIYSFSQDNYTSDSTPSLTLDQCINYSLKHQPSVNQALINESIAHLTNSIILGAWLPQVNANGSFTHYNNLPTNFIPNNANPGGPPLKTQTGVSNTFVPMLTATQAIFSPQLLFAAKSAPLFIRQAQLGIDSAKIYTVAGVSKSFYSLLQTLEQINVLKEDTARLDKNLSDAYHQYIAGLVDETDYDEAGITLNNSKAQLKQAVESIVPLYANLKQVMGYPPEKQFNVVVDTVQMMQSIDFDTTAQLEYEKRIEYKQLENSKEIQEQTTHYYRSAFLPTLSAFFNYNLAFQNNDLSSLFASSYPYSFMGLSFSIPIFTGFARIHSVQKSRLQEQLIDWGSVSLRSEIYSQYTSAMANYKSNLYSLELMKDNVDKAKRVYTIVRLQYQQGVVAYLNVITAEENLISSEIGYTNALFQLLSSKIDLETSMGIISTNY